jgi:hypothetical protein
MHRFSNVSSCCDFYTGATTGGKKIGIGKKETEATLGGRGIGIAGEK